MHPFFSEHAIFLIFGHCRLSLAGNEQRIVAQMFIKMSSENCQHATDEAQGPLERPMAWVLGVSQSVQRDVSRPNGRIWIGWTQRCIGTHLLLN